MAKDILCGNEEWKYVYVCGWKFIRKKGEKTRKCQRNKMR